MPPETNKPYCPVEATLNSKTAVEPDGIGDIAVPMFNVPLEVTKRFPVKRKLYAVAKDVPYDIVPFTLT